jgi:polysaccharide pyruvyl transferase WcaK-like protein
MRESVRVQRLLHHFSDAVSTRDDDSKRVMSAYGLSANRVSVSGDLALGIAPVAPAPVKNRVALFISSTLPSRGEFGYTPAAGDAEGPCASAIRSLTAALLKDGKKLSVFHNADEESAAFARDTFNGFDPDRLTLVAPDRSFKEVLQEIAKCESTVSFTYHGVLLSALCGVPAVSFAAERGISALAKTLGLDAFVLPTLETSAALSALQTLLGSAGLREALTKRVSDLRKKEAQNLRAMEALVPKRDVYAKEKQQGKYAKEEFEDPIGEGRRKKRPRGRER